VSLLWRDEVAIYLAPRKLGLLRRARGIRPRVLATTGIAVEAGTAGELAPVLARLAEALAESTWHGAAARVVLADNRWVRYGIVPWTAARLDAAGRLAQARYVLGDAWGEVVADWAVTLADTPPGRSCVACAMPATLPGALEETLAPARLALVSLQPRLIAAFNAWRHRLPADDTWFASLDDGLLSAVHLSGGAWDRVHVARLSQEWGVELARLQTLGGLTRGDGEPGRVFVDAPAWMRRDASAIDGVEWLEEDGGDGELELLQRMRA
jgi:hypothetical protein